MQAGAHIEGKESGLSESAQKGKAEGVSEDTQGDSGAQEQRKESPMRGSPDAGAAATDGSCCEVSPAWVCCWHVPFHIPRLVAAGSSVGSRECLIFSLLLSYAPLKNLPLIAVVQECKSFCMAASACLPVPEALLHVPSPWC